MSIHEAHQKIEDAFEEEKAKEHMRSVLWKPFYFLLRSRFLFQILRNIINQKYSSS